MLPDKILQKSLAGQILSESEITALLSLKTEAQIRKVFQAARIVQQKYFQNKIFLYGFVYFSTHCRNNCSFCYYRKTNDSSPRYRKTLTESVEIAEKLSASGVHLIDLTMGEDPFFLEPGTDNKLAELIRSVKEASGLPVMISPGLIPTRTLKELKEAGADWYAVYQETHNRRLFGKLRTEQSYDNRMIAKIAAKNIGLLIEEGILLGVGEQITDITQSIMNMKKLQVKQARVMSLVPQQGTPLGDTPPPPKNLELLTIAVMRLVLKDVLIPASLDIEGIAGLRDRLFAGANVVTSIIPPKSGLAGVSQSVLDIDEGFRTVSGVKSVLASMGLQAAFKQDYLTWLNKQNQPGQKEGDCHETGNYRRTAAGN